MFDTCHNVAKREVAMKSMSSREVIKLIEQDGWYLVAVVGSHHQFKYLTKPGKVTIPHPKTRLAPKTVSSILKQAGLL
jgi:predicted RNA binding protein YcfA (HicA-like mRNA interferase family)